MENSRFIDCLAGDYQRIRVIVPGHFDADVPSCPGWTVADLTRHVAEVYLHKVAAMRQGSEPAQWPPPGLDQEEPVELLDRAYAELLGEFTSRDPGQATGTWYTPDQTVGFWIRRMAHETLIHRIDAELAVGQPVAPVSDDLAIDGVDEVLKVFVAYSVSEWPDYFADILAEFPGHSYAIHTDGGFWRVTTGPGTLTVEGGPDEKDNGSAPVDLTVSGTPTAILRWVWNRESPSEPSSVTFDGSQHSLAVFQRCVVIATQ